MSITGALWVGSWDVNDYRHEYGDYFYLFIVFSKMWCIAFIIKLKSYLFF